MSSPLLRRSICAPLVLVLVATACSGGEKTASQSLRTRVLDLREQAVQAAALPPERTRPASMLESLECDDTGDPSEADLVRATAGQEFAVPAADTSKLAVSTGEAIAVPQAWRRSRSSMGDGWDITTDDEFMIYVRALRPGVLSIRVTSPCREAD